MKSLSIEKVCISTWILVAFAFKILIFSVTWPEAFVFGFVILNFTHKRSLKIAENPEFEKNITEIKSKIEHLKSVHANVEKIAEESKKLLSQSNLAMGFQARGQNFQRKYTEG